MTHPLVQSRGRWMRDVISDADVVRRVQAGESELFELLVRRHNQRLFRVVRSIAIDDDEAEEALQLAYVNAWRALDDFAGRSSFSTWITRIALRTALTLVTKRQRQQQTEALAAGELAEQSGSITGQAQEQEELRKLIEAAIDTLPAAYRVVFVLRMVEGRSTAEVASDLELSESAVKVRLLRARSKLQVQLLRRAEELGVLPLAWKFDGNRCDRVVLGVFARLRELGDD